MSGSKYFTALDLIRGFWALPVVERDPQKTAFTGPDGDSKLERRALRLEEFDFEVEHLPGEQNVVADHLSRQVPHLMAGSVTAVAGHLAFATAGRVLDVAGNGGDVQDPRAWVASNLQHLWTSGDTEAITREPCSVCGEAEGSAHMVLCDISDHPYHLQCLQPPRSVVPDGPWHCHLCDDAYLG